MAMVFFAASFFDGDVTAGDAGRILARMFAAALLVAGLFMFLLALVLLRDDRDRAGHIVFPVAVGIAMGLLASLLFLELYFELLFLPFLLLIVVFRPVRRRIFARRTAARPAAR